MTVAWVARMIGPEDDFAGAPLLSAEVDLPGGPRQLLTGDSHRITTEARRPTPIP
jgi:hypothetical protein